MCCSDAILHPPSSSVQSFLLVHALLPANRPSRPGRTSRYVWWPCVAECVGRCSCRCVMIDWYFPTPTATAQAAQEEEKRIRKRQPWQVVGVVVVLRLSRMVSASWNGVVCHLVIQNKKITRRRCGWARGVLIIFSAGPRRRTSLAKVQFVQVRRSTCSSDRRLIWPCAEQEQPGPVSPAWPDVRTLRC